jgi:hypothetical protein
METDTLKISKVRTPQRARNSETRVPEVKPRKLNECSVCGMKTYQKDALCVLCKTGITQACGELQ